VAALAVAASLFDETEKEREGEPFHYTLAVRWVGQDMGPYPPQGCTSDGFPNAQLALQSALLMVRKRDKLKIRKGLLREPRSSGSSSVVPFARVGPRDRTPFVKPYGICVAVPLYIFLAAAARKILQAVLPFLPTVAQDAVTSVTAFCLSSATLLLQGRIPQLLARVQWLHRGGIHKYISF
jgi:hypothetical protein